MRALFNCMSHKTFRCYLDKRLYFYEHIERQIKIRNKLIGTIEPSDKIW